MPLNNTERFSDRVEDYIRYRPHYPPEIWSILMEKYELEKSWIIADIGAGTGISSELFIENGLTVYAIEPNKEMREAGASIFKDKATYHSLNGTAESTGLEDNSIDLIFCGQAFHWFNGDKAKSEFKRILKPDGWVALCWNRRKDDEGFSKEYERLLRTELPNYLEVNHKDLSIEDMERFYSPFQFDSYSFENSQQFDFESLCGRIRSSSYCPKQGEEWDQLQIKLNMLFDIYQERDTIRFEYETHLYIGRIVSS